MEPRTGKRADSGRPRPSLSPRLIVEACLALMDAEGADALTFRRGGGPQGGGPRGGERPLRRPGRIGGG
ncbi:hypothetical protein, partial [Streptomyces sp. NPDC127118]|uniref:hypothetical protein n=1 Tax=Streptomyces sp. NPDC127118 TaxID=3345369 RepID=UPI003632E57B